MASACQTDTTVSSMVDGDKLRYSWRFIKLSAHISSDGLLPRGWRTAFVLFAFFEARVPNDGERAFMSNTMGI